MRSTHSEFILEPLSKMIGETSFIVKGIDNGMETYPLWDYLMQSLFIRLTGAQEQKLKCICWDISTINYEIRVELFGNNSKSLNCSTLKDKNAVLQKLARTLRERDIEIESKTDDLRDKAYREAFRVVDDFFIEMGLHGAYENNRIVGERLFKNWMHCPCAKFDKVFYSCSNCSDGKSCSVGVQVAKNLAGVNKNIGENLIENLYESLYRHRNRCAHNLLSYQKNLPNLKALVRRISIYENYYTWFMLLVFIDELVMSLYSILKNDVDSTNMF